MAAKKEPAIKCNVSYQRGYRAGLKTGRAAGESSRHMTDAEFFDAAMLALLPEVFKADGWKRGETKITRGPDRMDLAGELARNAVKSRHKYR